MKTQMKSQRGFTLIELLVVIGILAILLAITLIAINPAHQFAQANNTKRRSDILQVLNAYGQWIAENKGNLPTDLTKSMAAKALTAANFPNACTELVSGTPAYIPALPTDPSKNTTDVDVAKCTAGGWDTGYTIAIDANGRITVAAPLADEGATISVTR
jgi:prepilin-type N-terminal cleavage/methylation domain-containing protein